MADKEIKEEVKMAEKEAAAEEKTETVKISSKRQRKIDNREAKAARKAKNKVEESQKRPNNLIIFILIFGVLIVMFGFIWGYNYFSKEASIESYIESNGGKDTFGSIAVDEKTNISIEAVKNDMTITINMKDMAKKDAEKAYAGEDGDKQMKFIGAYYLNAMKPYTRAFSAQADVVAKLDGKEFNKVTVKYKDAKKIMEEYASDAQSGTAEE